MYEMGVSLKISLCVFVPKSYSLAACPSLLPAQLAMSSSLPTALLPHGMTLRLCCMSILSV